MKFMYKLLIAFALVVLTCLPSHQTFGQDPGKVSVRFPATMTTLINGRLFVMFSTDNSEEPRFQIGDGVETQQIFGLDIEDWNPQQPVKINANVLGYPKRSLSEVPAGKYWVQVLFHKYEVFNRKDGHTVKLPMDRGEGQQWNRAPGNLYSTPREVEFGAGNSLPIDLEFDQVIPKIEPPADTKYIKHIKIRSKLLSDFWGRDMYLGAHVLLPEGFDEHPEARYPLVVNHGHFPSDFGGFRVEPPDPNLKPEFSKRFNLDGYNKIVQEQAHDFYKTWTGEDFPRVLLIKIQHANPFYDDSYAVNSENLGPYGDAITYELIPFIEKKFRGIGKGWARALYGGSTGG